MGWGALDGGLSAGNVLAALCDNAQRQARAAMRVTARDDEEDGVMGSPGG